MKNGKSTGNLAIRVSVVTLIVNIVLSAGKILAGLLAHSSAMMSDGVHSASDALSTIIVIVSVKISARKADDSHQYGHERYECIAAIILSFILIVTGLGIGYGAVQSIISWTAHEAIVTPGVLALVAAVVSIVVKEWMFFYTRRAAKILNSDALRADAWHHHSDALSSVGSFIGIFGARLGLPILDPIASLVICVLIVWTAVKITRDAITKLVDTSCDAQLEDEIREVALSVDGVHRVDRLRTRQFAARFYVDIEIALDGSLTLWESHDIGRRVHDAIESHFPDSKHCMVHVNPYDAAPTET